MKSKKSVKLSLSKTTVANLAEKELGKVKGGYVCTEDISGCDSLPPWCKATIAPCITFYIC